MEMNVNYEWSIQMSSTMNSTYESSDFEDTVGSPTISGDNETQQPGDLGRGTLGHMQMDVGRVQEGVLWIQPKIPLDEF